MNNESNITGRIVGAVCTALYALLFVGLILWGSFTLHHEDVIQGMIVDFGASEDSGFGDNNPVTADNVTYKEPTATPEDKYSHTQDVEEAPEEMESNTETNISAPVKEQRPVEEQPTDTREQPTINQLALFPGGSVESEDVSEGEVEGSTGNQGNQSGAESSVHLGIGNIDGFVPDWDLEGRTLINKIVLPPYKGKESGIVVIDICVNAKGEVTSAEFRAKGSSGVSPTSPLVTEAKKSAKTARFNTSEQDFAYGTITFKFVLKTH